MPDVLANRNVGGVLPAVDLGLVDPLAQRLGADTELLGHPRDHAEPLAALAGGLVDHSDGPLSELGRIPPLERAAAVFCHDSMFLQAVESPSKSVRFTHGVRAGEAGTPRLTAISCSGSEPTIPASCCYSRPP